MKVEGNENELRKFFKSKKRINWKFLKFDSKKLTRKNKTIIVSVILIIGFLMLNYLMLYLYFSMSSNHITKTECSLQTSKTISRNLNLTWEQQLKLNLFPMMKFLIVCLGISWLLHGVGFRIL